MNHDEPPPPLTNPASTHSVVSAHLARVIAAKAAVDPRTVRAYVAGSTVASTCSARIEKALTELAMPHLLRRPEGADDAK